MRQGTTRAVKNVASRILRSRDARTRDSRYQFRDSYSFSVFLKGLLSRDGEHDAALRWLLEAPPIYQSTPAWNHIIQYHSRRGHVAHAWKHFNHMKKRGLRPDSHTFSLLLTGCAQTTNHDQSVLRRTIRIWEQLLTECGHLKNDSGAESGQAARRPSRSRPPNLVFAEEFAFQAPSRRFEHCSNPQKSERENLKLSIIHVNALINVLGKFRDESSSWTIFNHLLKGKCSQVCTNYNTRDGVNTTTRKVEDRGGLKRQAPVLDVCEDLHLPAWPKLPVDEFTVASLMKSLSSYDRIKDLWSSYKGRLDPPLVVNTLKALARTGDDRGVEEGRRLLGDLLAIGGKPLRTDTKKTEIHDLFLDPRRAAVSKLDRRIGVAASGLCKNLSDYKIILPAIIQQYREPEIAHLMLQLFSSGLDAEVVDLYRWAVSRNLSSPTLPVLGSLVHLREGGRNIYPAPSAGSPSFLEANSRPTQENWEPRDIVHSPVPSCFVSLELCLVLDLEFDIPDVDSLLWKSQTRLCDQNGSLKPLATLSRAEERALNVLGVPGSFSDWFNRVRRLIESRKRQRA